MLWITDGGGDLSSMEGNEDLFGKKYINLSHNRSSGIFVFLYAIYFYVTKTQMHGFLQVMYFFGYSGLFSLAVFLVTHLIF